MAIDRGYGSGKPRSAANSSMRRRAAAGQMTKGKKKMGQLGSYKTPGLEAANRRTSDSLLEAFTGFNKKDGVDAGDFAGLAISIPTGGVGGALLRAGARAVIPKAARIASAAKRVTARNKSAVEAMSSRYREKSTEALEKRYAAKEMVQPKYVGSQTYEDRAFTDWSGGVDRAGNERTYFSRIAENLRNRGDVVRTNVQRDAFGVTEQYSQMPSFKQKVDAYSMDVDSVFADRAANRAASEARRISSLGRDTTAASAAEIKRRLAALKRANRNR
jgi:hypothetical protein